MIAGPTLEALLSRVEVSRTPWVFGDVWAFGGLGALGFGSFGGGRGVVGLGVFLEEKEALGFPG